MGALRVKYQTIEFGEVDIHVRILRDRQQFSDEQGLAEQLGISSAVWPLFGQVWPSGNVLAHHMFNYPITDQRILEVGCGIGLSSLVLNHRKADITATDYHPEVEGFLEKNTRLNEDENIPFVRTGWEDKKSGLGLFDLIIGSDILYEQEHVELLSEFINQHARTHCTIILVDPGRGHHARFSKRMVALGYTHSQYKPDTIDYLDEPFKGQILKYVR
nr:methyltransferase domain-containing protein [uncultured Desulfuromonas sp.]